MRKTIVKQSLYAMLIASTLAGCGQSPVRNPFAGRQEPKLGQVPAITESHKVAGNVTWSNSTLSKQERFTKLRPFVSHDKIFAADHSGKVVAFDRESGKNRWKVSTGKKFVAGPYYFDNRLILTTSDAMVVALDAQSGHTLWEKKVTSEVLAPPTGQQGIVLVHATDGSVSGLNLRNGEVLWSVEHPTPVLTLRYSSAPIVVDEKVLVGFATGKLLAFNLHNGLVEWERVIAVPRGRSEVQRMVDISADPIVVGDTAYVVTYQGKLASVNTTTGDLLWERDLSSYQNMAYDDDHIFVTDLEHTLWAIDRHSGDTAWKQTALAQRYITGPVVVDNSIVVGDRAGYLYYLSADNGHVIDKKQVSGKIYQNPMNMGSTLLVNTHNGKIAAIKTS